MKKSGLIVALLTGVGVKLLDDNKNRIKKHVKNFEKVNHSHLDAHYISNAYSRLSDDKKKLVKRNLYRIIPKRDMSYARSFRYQLDVYRYMRVLHYLSHRWEFHATHASKLLHIPLHRTQQIDIALTQQKCMDLTDASTEYVRQPRVNHILEVLNVHYTPGVNVNPLIFTKVLRNSIARNMFD